MPKSKSTTAPARLRLLLNWLNGQHDEHHFAGRNPEPVAVWTDYPAIRRELAAFVRSFDGTVGAGFVLAEPDDDVSALDDEAIGELEAKLLILLEQGFDPSPHDVALPLSSLRFAVRSTGRRKPAKRGSVIDGGVTALHNYRGPGAYVLRVEGPIRDLVPFLVAALLMAPDMVAVKRCARPGCSGFVVETGERGAPQKFCSELCRGWNRAIEQQEAKMKKERKR